MLGEELITFLDQQGEKPAVILTRMEKSEYLKYLGQTGLFVVTRC